MKLRNRKLNLMARRDQIITRIRNDYTYGIPGC